jgi:hypothetical protein
MKQLPHEVEKMGSTLRVEVEKQLLLDLSYYGVARSDLWIDWTEAC